MKRFTLCLVIALFLSGCGLLRTEPFVDTQRNQDGELILSDTERNWSSFKENVDFRIANEVAGKRPEGGSSTWQEFWLSFIANQKTGRENKDRYINYVIEARRANGLPELPGNT